MSIVKEFYKTRNDGVNLYKTYSNKGYKIHKLNTEEIYDEAIDIENAFFEYEETTEFINNENNATEEDYLEALEKLGVSE